MQRDIQDYPEKFELRLRRYLTFVEFGAEVAPHFRTRHYRLRHLDITHP